MRVGFDARQLTKPLTGIGRYATEITHELIKEQSDFYLYAASRISVDWLQQKSNVKVLSNNFRGSLGRLLWSQTYLPFWVARDKVNIFWGPSHRLPYCLPKKIARVVTIHDLVWKRAGSTMRPLSRFMESILMPQAIKKADIVVAVSKSTANDISKEYPIASDKIRVIYPGCSPLPYTDDPCILSELKITLPYILFVGTLEPRKNLKRLMKAFASLGEVNENVSLVIAGGKGWGKVNVNQWIKKYNLNGRATVVGYVTNKQLATLYASSLFLAMPSLYEGFGLPIVEAMSFGKPVLTSNKSSMPEVAGEAAFLVDPLDEQSIALGLRTLLDKKKRDKLAEKARKNAERFTWRASAEQLWEVFQEAIDMRKNAIHTNNDH